MNLARASPGRPLIVLSLALGLLVGACGSSDRFDVATDTLCDSVTAEDMNSIIGDAQQRLGTAYAFEAFASGECAGSLWRSEGGAHPAVWVMIAPVDGEGIDGAVRDSLSEVGPDEFERHHMLNDRVSHYIRTYQFAWNEGVDGFVRVDGHEDQTLYFGFGVVKRGSVTEMTGEYKDLGLAVVNSLLVRMNWIDPTA